MLHRRYTRFAPVACLAALLAGNIGTARAQSSQAGPTPNLSLSANARTAPQSYQGWALVFDATVFHPQIFSTSAQVTPLLINAQNGSWANTIRLVATDTNGVAQNWPIQLATIPSGSLSLDATNIGSLAWVVAPSDTAAIAAGTYRILAVLDTTPSAGTTGWNGMANSNSVSVQISSLPSPLTADLQEEQAELLGRYDHLVGNDTQAIADLSAFLNQQPNNIGALTLEGNFLEQMGQTGNALGAYDHALGAFYTANPGPLPEPPDALLIPEGRLRSQLFSQFGGRGTPQVAIQLLDQGTQSPGVFFLDLQITNVGNDVAQNVLVNQVMFQTLSGTGQAFLNNVLSPPLPIVSDFLGVNGSATIRVFVSVQGTVGDISLTENGTAADIFGTPTSFSQTQTIFLSGGGGSPLPLTLTASDATQQYGQPTPPLNNATYSGFVNGDTAASLSGIFSCTTTATQSSPVGSYPIICSGLNSPNYTITYVPGTLSITPAALTVTANNASRLYGQANPQFTASYSGLANGDTASSLSGTLGCTTTAMQSSPVGTYAINCSGLTSSNYTITYSPGQLTVTPAPLTITSNNASRQTGQPNPSFTVSYSGFVNGDTSGSLRGTLSCQTTATQASPAGTYGINCSGLTSNNYAITYLPGQLTISAPVCAGNVSASLAVTRSGFSYSPLAKRYAQTLTLTNASGAAIAGPIYVVLDNLSSNATLYNTGGSTSCAAPTGSPYVLLTGSLNTGATATVVLQFTNPTNAPINYATRILEGAGQP